MAFGSRRDTQRFSVATPMKNFWRCHWIFQTNQMKVWRLKHCASTKSSRHCAGVFCTFWSSCTPLGNFRSGGLQGSRTSRRAAPCFATYGAISSSFSRTFQTRQLGLNHAFFCMRGQPECLCQSWLLCPDALRQPTQSIVPVLRAPTCTPTDGEESLPQAHLGAYSVHCLGQSCCGLITLLSSWYSIRPELELVDVCVSGGGGAYFSSWAIQQFRDKRGIFQGLNPPSPRTHSHLRVPSHPWEGSGAFHVHKVEINCSLYFHWGKWTQFTRCSTGDEHSSVP